jgi:hypothetical protein
MPPSAGKARYPQGAPAMHEQHSTFRPRTFADGIADQTLRQGVEDYRPRTRDSPKVGGKILTDADASETRNPQQGFRILVIPPAQNRGKTGPFERGTIR